MDRTQQRCLIGSAVAHAALLTLVVVVGGLTASKVVQPDVPFLEIIPTDLKLTMGNQIGGGTPTPRPLADKEGTPPPGKSESPMPAPPAAKVETPKPPDVVKTAEPVKQVEKAIEEPKAEKKVEVSKTVKTAEKAQDVDLTKKADKPSVTPASKIQISNQLRTVSTADKQKAEREAREAREAREEAAAEAQAQAQRYAMAKGLASKLSGAASGVSQNVGGSTKIEMPGPGGAAYAPYTSWLQTFLYEQWHRPSTSSKGQEWVGVEVVIAKDGTVLGVTVKRSSGIRSLDASVEEIFRRNRKLRPLPDEFKEPRLVVPVKFVLEAPGSL